MVPPGRSRCSRRMISVSGASCCNRKTSANPEMPAPTMITLAITLLYIFPTNLGLEHVFQSAFDLLVRLIDLLVRQGAFLGLIRQRKGQAFRTGRNATAPIQVKQAHTAQQSAACRPHLGDNPFA